MPSRQSSGLASLDPRSKILLAVGFILTLSVLPPGEFLFYGLLLLLLYFGALLSGCGPTYLLKRSVIALPFAFAAMTLLFTVPGEDFLTMPLLGVDVSQEGVVRFASVVLKSWISVQAAALLVFLTPVQDLMWGLQGLRTPSILVSIAGFTYRYLDVIRSEASRLRTARASRSAVFKDGRAGGSLLYRARVTGWMVGSLMMRSIERSDRIYNAMLARGYRGKMVTMTKYNFTSRDVWVVFFASLAAVVIVTSAYLI